MPAGPRVRVQETEKGEALPSAAVAGEIRPFGTASLAACLLKFPSMTWKIVAGIHWEVLKLSIMGVLRRLREGPGA